MSGTGDVLSPATVRRLACDASLIAAVLGGQGEPLDVARQHRLVTPAIRTALVLRDKGCSFPGCTVPAAWTDAHHLVHWIDGGATSLDNLTLLCRRHHTHVHRQGLTATVTPTGVTWHTWQQWRRDVPRRSPTGATPAPSDGSHHSSHDGLDVAATDPCSPAGDSRATWPDERAGPPYDPD
ncbi:HNH endonuclease [Humibacillus xanthopallidus]